ncbi:hypothetical protein L6164_036272 [Bauhinia variegata]|uniref:Uncharacterized protein n=1 Tax=Bauhinia variegata TaxID=167791 RepID=A0ACB9KGF1_BAUVA|nr:hypothetical protein L6164_036272 [Bauhinia variegata]
MSKKKSGQFSEAKQRRENIGVTFPAESGIWLIWNPIPKAGKCSTSRPGLNDGSSSARDLAVLPSTMADEEVVDQKALLEESCKPKCVKPLLEYQACVKRIQGDESGHKHCTGQYFDYWSCIDKCVALKLFAKLK